MSSKLFAGVPDHLKIWNSHGDHVVGLPAGFSITGRTDNAVAAVENPRNEDSTASSFIPK